MKKKICILLTLILVLGIFPLTAFADPTPAPEPTSILSIENSYVDVNMNNKTYAQGYVPIIWEGKAFVVLPLKSSEPLNNVSVTVNLGDPASSPFVFGNYDQTVPLQSGLYVATLTLPLIQSPVIGRYPVVVTANYTKQDNSVGSQSFTVYVTVSDGIDPNATPAPTPTPTPEPTEAPLPQPKIIMDSHTITPEQVMAGETFSLNVTLKNTSDSQSVQNIKVTAKGGETADLIPVEDTGSAYIKKIGPGKTEDFLVKIQVRQDAKPGPQIVSLAIEYENSKAVAFTTSEEIIIQVKQPIRLEYDPPTIPESVNAGDTISISMNLMNMGKSTLYNVRCALEAPGLMPEGSVFLGNMESGTSKTGDIYVFVGTLDMGGPGATGDSLDTGAETGTGGDAAVPDETAGEQNAVPTSESVPAVGEAPAANAGNAQTVAVAVAVPEVAVNSKEMIVPADDGAPQDGTAEGDMGQAGQYGPTQGTIVITYEDEYGQEYSQEVPFQTMINPPVIQPVSGDEETPEEPETVSQWWISVIIAGGIAAGLIVFLRIRKKRRMRLEEENEDE